MSRRTIGIHILAASLALGAGGFLTGSASAAGCPAWTDAAGDAHFAENHDATKDDNLDIVAAKVGVVGDKMVAEVKTTGLTSAYSDFGDEFRIEFTMGGKVIWLYADRDQVGNSIGFWNVTDDKVQSGGTANYNTATKTVTFSQTLAKLDLALGSASAGRTMGAVTAATSNQLQGGTVWDYDTARLAGTYGLDACSMDEATAVVPVAAPLGSEPTAGCVTIADGPSDGTPTYATVQGTRVGTANDPDLDITGVAVRTTPSHLTAVIKVAQLAAKPAQGLGHQFDFSFTTGGKTIQLYVATHDSLNAVRDRLSPTALIPQTGGRVIVGTSSKYDDRLDVSAEMSVAKSRVTLSVERSSLETVLGTPLTDGTVVTATAAHSSVGTVTGTASADTAQATGADNQTYAIGDNACFPPPPAKFAPANAVSVQYGDKATVAATLTSDAGAPLEGKQVTFTVGTSKATATTDASGVARTTLATTKTAGSYQMAVSFIGDSAAGPASLNVPFAVRVEKCKLTLSVAKQGTRRTVTATLADDDRHAVAGQTVSWYVAGRKVATTRTNSAGRASYAGAKPGQTVVAKFAGVSGKYGTAQAQARA